MEDPLFQRQIDSELKNALKSEERKKTQKRKLENKSKEEEPPKKKEKKTNNIPITVRDVEAIRQYFWTDVVYNPVLDKVLLYSGLNNEVLAFGAFPILLSAPKRDEKKQLVVGEDYILGTSKTYLVIAGLRVLFARLYPDKSPLEYQHWDAYKFNRAYYGIKAEKNSYNQEALELQLVETKPFGGPRDCSSVHWLEEAKLKRWDKAVSLEKYLSDKDVNKIKKPKIPKEAKCWPADHLKKINERVEQLKRDLLVAEKESTEALKKKEISEAIKNLKNTDSDESSDDDEE